MGAPVDPGSGSGGCPYGGLPSPPRVTCRTSGLRQFRDGASFPSSKHKYYAGPGRQRKNCPKHGAKGSSIGRREGLHGSSGGRLAGFRKQKPSPIRHFSAENRLLAIVGHFIVARTRTTGATIHASPTYTFASLPPLFFVAGSRLVAQLWGDYPHGAGKRGEGGEGGEGGSSAAEAAQTAASARRAEAAPAGHGGAGHRRRGAGHRPGLEGIGRQRGTATRLIQHRTAGGGEAAG